MMIMHVCSGYEVHWYGNGFEVACVVVVGVVVVGFVVVGTVVVGVVVAGALVVVEAVVGMVVVAGALVVVEAVVGVVVVGVVVVGTVVGPVVVVGHVQPPQSQPRADSNISHVSGCVDIDIFTAQECSSKQQVLSLQVSPARVVTGALVVVISGCGVFEGSLRYT